MLFISWENLGMIHLRGNPAGILEEILMILKDYKYVVKGWNWDREFFFKRMNIIVKVNKLFMNVERIKWIEESLIRSKYDL